MKTYNLFDKKEPATIIYHTIAGSEDQIQELANNAGFDISGLEIEIERENVKNQLSRQFKPTITKAIIQ